jgi:alpha-tubulin suppressor-like RCC1 family protein
LWAWGFNGNGQLGDGTTTNRQTPAQLTGVTDVSAIAAGLSQSVIVTVDGSVWAWGFNANGTIGDGTLNDRLLPVRLSDPNFTWKTATPRLAPYTGTYSAVTNVCHVDYAVRRIHYTTNGKSDLGGSARHRRQCHD